MYCPPLGIIIICILLTVGFIFFCVWIQRKCISNRQNDETIELERIGNGLDRENENAEEWNEGAD